MDVFLEVLERVKRAKRVSPTIPKLTYNDLPLPAMESKISLHDLLNRLGPLPPYSAMIGVCEDGLPYLLDLADPSPGSILAVADEYCGKTRLLQAILASASALNAAEQVSFTVLAPNPGEYEMLHGLDSCSGVISAFDRAASEVVVELAELADQRINGRGHGPIEILAIDDLAAFMQNNDYEVNCYLNWLIANGPHGAVWPISAINTGQLWRIRDGLLEAYGTIFVGRTSSYQLTDGALTVPDYLEIPGVFNAWMGEEWMRFWVPEIA